MHIKKSYLYPSLFFMAFFSFFIVSCSQKAQTTTEAGGEIPLEQVGEGQGQGQGAQGQGEIKEGVIDEEGIRVPGEGSNIMEGRTSAPFQPIYFDFDSYVIRPDMMERMEYNAKVMQEHPDIKVEIQGNCDERGTNEYNLALGEKRAKAARDYLVNMGISPDRISIVSLGEEKPLDPRHNEEAWAKNRRDDFVIYR